MTYTVWSRNRLLGSSPLAFGSDSGEYRQGKFEPTELGERLMPWLSSTPAAIALSESRRARDQADGTDDAPPSLASDKNSSEYADWLEAGDVHTGLQLELRDENGLVVPTTLIVVRDVDAIVAALRDAPEPDYELTPEQEADVEHDARLVAEWFDNQPWRPEEPPMRFQLQVLLGSGDDDPAADDAS
jgi:hypothetical protein